MSARNYLIKSQDLDLVLAGGKESFWGIGVSFKDKNILNEDLWKGDNVYGKLLMEIRDNIIINECNPHAA